ncbi:MAG: nucleotidyl transferase AbiEii/AbiGii toxin family protein [Planctomycetota bacterium]
MTATCYWAGTAAIAIEELHHRQSFDLDFHTRAALHNVRPILAEIQAAFPGAFAVVQAPDEFGSGFQGILTLPEGEQITVEVLSNYEDVPIEDLVDAQSSPNMKRVSLSRYLADKIQCVVERLEARDLVDIMAVLQRRPDTERLARQLVAQQDAVLLAERLMGWTDEQIEKDLHAYRDVSAGDACKARDLLLGWVKAAAGDDSQQ